MQEGEELQETVAAVVAEAESAHSPRAEGPLGVVLTGGGARGAYQVGVLQWIAKRYPTLRLPILTGVSAGAVNTAFLASHPGDFRKAVLELAGLWRSLTVEKVFRSDAGSIGWTVLRWGFRLISGGARPLRDVRGFLDTEPLQKFLTRVLPNRDGVLTGIAENIARGRLSAAAVTATSYTTGQTVVFTQGQDVTTWRRPQRRSEQTVLTIRHVMASSSLPMFFPAVRVGDEWFGDGGMRLTAPLSSALHLGAGGILAISTRYDRTANEAEAPQHVGYPPPAQVLGSLLNAVFLDLIDQDALRLQLINGLIERMPADQREGLRRVELLVIRPSRDLGRLSAEFEPRLPRAFRFMTRGLGTRETTSPDVLSLLMFQPDYIDELITIGERDAEARGAEIDAFIESCALEWKKP
jgi:NTE family protein